MPRLHKIDLAGATQAVAAAIAKAEGHVTVTTTDLAQAADILEPHVEPGEEREREREHPDV